MKLSKKHKYTVLCEDKLTHCFIRRFLLAQGISGRKIFPLPLPADGCGEQYVRSQFPKRLRALRSKSFDSNVLIVAIDADKMAERFSAENFTSELSALQDAYNEYCALVSLLNA